MFKMKKLLIILMIGILLVGTIFVTAVSTKLIKEEKIKEVKEISTELICKTMKSMSINHDEEKCKVKEIKLKDDSMLKVDLIKDKNTGKEVYKVYAK